MPSGSHDINVKLLALIGIVSTILMVSLVVATQAWFRYEFGQENQRKYIDVPYRQLEDLKQAQLADLHAPQHTVEFDGKYRTVIPIDEAVQKVIDNHTVMQESTAGL
jgi:hypothetical protein